MTLINCEICGKEIAKQAKLCPHCGIKRNTSKFKRFFWVVAGVILFFAILNALNGKESADAPLNATPVSFSASEVPACSSSEGINLAKIRFAECYSLNGNNQIKDIQRPVQIGYSETEKLRKCGGTVVTSNGREYPAVYEFSTLTDGSIWTEINIQTPSGTNYNTCTQ